MQQAPSMTGLRAFDAVVRHGSLTGAACELCVTPAAISHRLKDLERLSGAALLRRDGGVFRPTHLGEAVLEQLGDAFDRIRRAHAVLEEPTPERRLHVVASYSFAVLWLLPHLPEFQAAHPGVQITIDPNHQPLSAVRDREGISIVHADARPEGDGWVKLFDDVCAVVAKSGHPLLRDPDGLREALGRWPLVHISHDHGGRRGEYSWREWAADMGFGRPALPAGLQVTAEHAAIEVIMANWNLALVSLINADRFLGEDRLGVCEGSQQPSGKSYWLRASVGDPEVSGPFVSWLSARTAATAGRYAVAPG